MRCFAFFYLSLCFLRWTSNSTFTHKHGFHWTSESIIDTSISNSVTWTNIPNASLIVNMSHPRPALITYQVNIESIWALPLSPLPREDQKDVLQMRCLINNVPIRVSSSFIASYAVEEKSAKVVKASFVMNMTESFNIISLQWKTTGNRPHRWVLSTIGSSYAISVSATFESTYFVYEYNDVIIKQNNMWQPLLKSMQFFVPIEMPVLIGYSASIQPQIVKFIKDSGIENIYTRIVVDDVSYELGSLIYGCSLWNPLTANLHSIIHLKLLPGPHVVKIEWKKVGSVISSWLSAPSLFDGFAASRNLYVLIDKHQMTKTSYSVAYSPKVIDVVSGMGIHRSSKSPILESINRDEYDISGDGIWTTVGNRSSLLYFDRETVISIQYSFPITQLSSPSFDSFTWTDLSTVSTRFIIDNVIYEQDQTAIGENTRSIINAVGSTTVILPRGHHTVSLQWRADQNVNWTVFQDFSNSFIKPDQFFVVESAEIEPFLILIPPVTYTYENTAVNLTNLFVDGPNDGYGDKISIHMIIQVNIGSFYFFDFPINSNSSYKEGTRLNIFEIYDTRDILNQILKRFTYVPKYLYYGNDTLMVIVSDQGYLCHEEEKVSVNQSVIVINHVDQIFKIIGNERYRSSISMDTSLVLNISLIDVDSSHVSFRVETMASCGFLSLPNISSYDLNIISGQGYLENSLIYEGHREKIIQSLKRLEYKTNIGCGQYQGEDTLFINISSLTSPYQSQQLVQKISLDTTNPILSLKRLPSPQWTLHGFSLNNDSSSVGTYYLSSLGHQNSLAFTSLISAGSMAQKSNIAHLVSHDAKLEYIFQLNYDQKIHIIQDGSNYLPENSLNEVIILRVINSLIDEGYKYYCQLEDELYAGEILQDNRILCYVNMSFHNQTIWVTVVSIANETVMQMSNYLPYYIQPQPYIIDYKPLFMFTSEYQIISLIASNTKIITHCTYNNRTEPIIASSSLISCAVRNISSLDNNIKLVIHSSDGKFVSNTVNIHVLAPPIIKYAVTSRINGSCYLIVETEFQFFRIKQYLSKTGIFNYHMNQFISNDLNSSSVITGRQGQELLPVCIFQNFSVIAQWNSTHFTCLLLTSPINLIEVTLSWVGFSTSFVINASCEYDKPSEMLILTDAYQNDNGSISIQGSGFLSSSRYVCLDEDRNEMYETQVFNASQIVCFSNRSRVNSVRLHDDTGNTQSNSIFVENHQLRKISHCFQYNCQIFIDNQGTLSSVYACSYQNSVFPALSTEAGSVCSIPIQKVGLDEVSLLYIDEFSSELIPCTVSMNVLKYPALLTSRIIIVSGEGSGKPIIVSGENFPMEYQYSIDCLGMTLHGSIINDSAIAFPVDTTYVHGKYVARVLCYYQKINYVIGELLVMSVEPIRLIDVFPDNDDFHGGATVVIRGENFFLSESIFCLFENNKVRGIFSSFSTVDCIVPGNHFVNQRVVNLTVEMDGYKMTSGLQFYYVPPVILYDMQPKIGSLHGNTTVKIYGQGFRYNNRYDCFFDDVVVQAAVINLESISCVSPAKASNGTVVVSIYQNRKQVNYHGSNERFLFSYEVTPTVYGINSTVKVSGDESSIALFGAGFSNYHSFLCDFENVSSVAIIVNDEIVLCKPPIKFSKTTVLSLKSINVDEISYGSFPVEFIHPLRLKSIFPSHGSAVSQNSVILILDHVASSGEGIECIVGTHHIPSFFINSTALRCLLPPHDSSESVRVYVSISQYMSNFVYFEYVYPPTVTRIHPSKGSVLGGQIVYIFGFGMNIQADLYCMFGDIRVSGLVLNDSCSVCVTIAHSVSSVNVSVYFDKLKALETIILTFSFFDSPSIIEGNVSWTQIVGGDTILIKGQRYLEFNSNIVCDFGVKESPAVIANETQLSCNIPHFNKESDVFYRKRINSVHELESSLHRATSLQADIDFNTYPLKILMQFGRLCCETLMTRNVHEKCILYIRYFGSCENLISSGHISLDFVDALHNSSAQINKLSPSRPQNESFNISLRETFPLRNIIPVTVRSSFGDFMGAIPLIYIPNMEIESVSPRVVSPFKYTKILVKGNQFISGAEVYCRFDETYMSEAIVLSTSLIECKVPVLSKFPGNLHLSLVVDNRIVDSAVMIDIFIPAVIDSIFPTSVTTSGNKQVFIRGFGYSNVFNYYCLFGSIRVPAQYLSSTELNCLCPSHSEGIVTLTVYEKEFQLIFQNGSDARFEFKYERKSHLITSSNYQEASNDAILVRGEFININKSTRCIFTNKNLVSGLTFINSTVALCPVPASVSSFSTTLNVENDDESFDGFINVQRYAVIISKVVPSRLRLLSVQQVFIFGPFFASSLTWHCLFDNITVEASLLNITTLTCNSPALASNIVNISVAANGFQSFNTISSELINPCIIHSIQPQYSRSTDGSEILIVGDGFQNDTVVCEFGDHRNEGRFLSSTTLACISPPHSIGIVKFRIILNDLVCLHLNGSQFSFHRFIEGPSVHRVIPKTLRRPTSELIFEGNGFLEAEKHEFYCYVSDKWFVNAIVLNDSFLACQLMHYHLTEDYMFIKLVMNHTKNSFEVIAHHAAIVMDDIIIHSLLPFSSSASSSSVLHILGDNFDPDTGGECIFGDNFHVDAVVMNSTVATCTLPPTFVLHANVSVRVCFNICVHVSLEYQYHNERDILKQIHDDDTFNSITTEMYPKILFYSHNYSTLHFMGHQLSKLETSELCCRVRNVAPVVYVNDSYVRCDVIIPKGVNIVSLVMKDYVVAESLVYVIDPNIQFTWKTTYILAGADTLIEVVTSTAVSYVKYSCRINGNQSILAYMLPNNVIVCSVYVSIAGNITIDLLLQNSLVVSSSSLVVVLPPVISSANLSLLNNVMSVITQVDTMSSQVSFVCDLGNYSVLAIPQSNRKYWACPLLRVSEIPRVVQLVSIEGSIRTNIWNLSLLQDHDVLTYRNRSSDTNVSTKALSTYFENFYRYKFIRDAYKTISLSPSGATNVSLGRQDVINKNDHTIYFVRNELALVSILDSNRTIFGNNENCFLFNNQSCFVDREKLKFSSSFNDEVSLVSNRSLRHFSYFLVDDYEPKVIFTRNDSWITIHGRGFRNTSYCYLPSIDRELLTLILTHTYAQCYLPSLQQLRLNVKGITIFLMDRALPEDYRVSLFIAFRYARYETIDITPNVPEMSRNISNIDNFSSSKALNQKSTCDVVPMLFQLSNNYVSRMRANYLALNILTSMPNLKSCQNNVQRLNLTSLASHKENASVENIKYQSYSDTYLRIPSARILTRQIVKQTNTARIHFQISNLMFPTCLKVEDLDIVEKCFTVNSSTVECVIDLNQFDFGEYEVSLLLNCKQTLVTSDIQILHSDQSIEYLGSKRIVARVEPLVAFTDITTNLYIYGSDLHIWSYCYLKWIHEQSPKSTEYSNLLRMTTNETSYCAIESFQTEGMAELFLANNEYSIATNAFVTIVNAPFIYRAEVSYENATIEIFGEKFNKNLPCHCTLNGLLVVLPGNVVNEKYIVCGGFVHQNLLQLQSLQITFNGVDYFPVFTVNIKSKSKDLIIQADTNKSDPDTSISNTDATESISIPAVQYTGFCNGNTSVTITLKHEINFQSFSYCLFQRDGFQFTQATGFSVDSKTIRCNVPHLSPGPYDLKIVNSMESNYEIFPYRCLIEPRIVNVIILPISESDGSITFKLYSNNLSFGDELDIYCVYGIDIARVFRDFHNIYCTFDNIITNEENIFRVFANNAILFSTYFTLSESDLVTGRDLVYDTPISMDYTFDEFQNVRYVNIALTPPQWQSSGGVRVVVKFAKLDLSMSYTCFFDEIIVIAVVLNVEQLVCITPEIPPHDNGTLKVTDSSGATYCCGSFAVYPRIILSSVSTSFVNAKGGDLIGLHSFGYTSFEVQLYCYFGSSKTKSIARSSDDAFAKLFQCLTPPLIAPTVMIQIGSNDEIWSTSISLPVLNDSIVSFVAPLNGSIYGRTKLFIHFIDDVPFRSPSCLFGENQAIQDEYDSTKRNLYCWTPDHHEDIVSLQIYDRYYLMSSKLRVGYFSFQRPAQIVSLSPSIVQLNKTTEVLVSGDNFVDRSTLCFIGGRIVTTIWLSKTKILCIIRIDEGYKYNYLLQVSNNGYDLFSSSLQIQGQRVLMTVHPLIGFVTGKTPITLNLTVFAQFAGKLKCLFDSFSVLAVQLNELSYVCYTPMKLPGLTNFLVSDDADTLWKGYFEFVDLPVIESINVSAVIASQRNRFEIYGFSFSDKMIGFVDGLPVCLVENDNTMNCDLVSSIETSEYIEIRISVNRGVDFYHGTQFIPRIFSGDIFSISPPFIIGEIPFPLRIQKSTVSRLDYPLYCNLKYDGQILILQAFDIRGSILCNIPAIPLSADRKFAYLSISQLNVSISNSVPLAVVPSPVVKNISSNISVVGHITVLRVLFAQSMPSVGLQCVLDNFDFYPITMMSDNSEGYCRYLLSEPGRHNLSFRIQGTSFDQDEIADFVIIAVLSPTDLTSNASSVLQNSDNYVKISSQKCLFPTVEMSCRSFSHGSIVTVVAGACDLVCKIANVSDIYPIDIGICYGNVYCQNYQYVSTLRTLSVSILFSLSPSNGPSTGNSTVLVYGDKFEESSSCFIEGAIQVPARILSKSKLLCLMPSHHPGIVSLSIYRHGIMVSKNTLLYEYTVLYTIIDVYPKVLSSEGSAVLTISISSPLDLNKRLGCKFGSEEVTAVIVDHNVITCASPQIGIVSELKMSITADHAEITYPYTLKVVEKPNILFLDPLSVYRVQNDVHFTFFFDKIPLDSFDSFKCKFDGHQLKADVFISDNSMRCILQQDFVDFRYEHSLRLYFAGVLLKSFVIDVYDFPVIERIYPIFGFSSVSTKITLSLINSSINEQSTEDITKCCFQSQDIQYIVPASRITSSIITCYAPNVEVTTEESEMVRVGLLYTDGRCEYSNLEFTVSRVPVVVSSSRYNGSIYGGDVISLVLYSGVPVNMQYYCRIGTKSTVAHLVSRTLIVCRTLQGVVGSFDIELSVNNIDFVPTGFMFEYLPFRPLDAALRPSYGNPVIDKVFPENLSSGQVQTVHVYGSNILFGSYCKLGEFEVLKSIFISSNELECMLQIHSIGSESIAIVNPGNTISNTKTVYFGYAPYLYINAVDSVTPNYGPLSKSTTITVHGRNLDLITPSVLCLIGNTYTAPVSLSNTSVTCETPPTIVTGNVKVQLANINKNIIPGYGIFEYIDDPGIFNVYPSQGYSGTQIYISGRGFKRFPKLTCIIGVEITAIAISDTKLVCIVTTLMTGNYSVLVGTNGQHVINSGRYFTYLSTPVLSAIWPFNGPAMKGNTIVSLSGLYFPTSVNIQCLFGASVVSAYAVSSTLIKCKSPSRTPGVVNVTVALNGVRIASNNTLQFEYIADASVYDIYPRHGLFSGDNIIFLFGVNFQNTSSLGCAFGDMKSRGTFISSSLITCLLPSPIGRSLYKSYDAVSVEVTNNGYDYTNSNVTFKYESSCRDGYYGSGISQFFCPNGTFCANDSKNFTLCPPGYFQPRNGQSNCIICSRGFICPDFGLTRPIICPAGHVCDTYGLTTPVKRCPSGYYCLNGTRVVNPNLFENANNVFNASIPWIKNVVTGVVYFNASSLDYSYLKWPYPAFGQSRVYHPPSYQCDGYDCVPGSLKSLAESPFPCPLGFYCRSGVSSFIPLPKNFSTPQKCFDGYFCPRGSQSPEGSGSCPNGYFCPTSTDAILCPEGHYCPGVGNTAPIECYPGTYNPYQGRANCSVCPAGFICPGWGSLLPEPCPAGFVCMGLGLSFPVVLCPAGYYCKEGTVTADPSDSTDKKPIPCPDRLFCLGGVANLINVEWIATQAYGANRPQLCSEGTYCESGAYQASGSGLCFLGHYCPPNSSFPIATPIGNFASSLGSVAPTLCYPGTYAPLEAQINCLPCPSGFTCLSYGTYQPTICPAGTFRAQVDAVVCISCPQGTYSYETGAPDISLCLPCPPSRICGVTNMNNLNATKSCSAGYICGHATVLSEEYSHEAPAGYYTSTDTYPSDQYSNPCSSGQYCTRATPDYLKSDAKCPSGYFCPQATTSSSSTDNLCPYLTTSSIGSIGILNCSIESINVCDKLTIEPYIPYQDVTYYSTFSYLLIEDNSVNITFNSSLQSTATYTGEVQVVRKVSPLKFNESTSLWVNDTIEAFRACPSYGSSIGNDVVTIIGRNFINSSSNYCRIRPCLSANRGISLRRCRNLVTDLNGNSLPQVGVVLNRTYITPATYISSTRMECNVPAFIFDTINFNPTFTSNYYECQYLADGYYAANSTGNYSYIRACDSSSSCVNLPETGYEYFTSIVIACSTTDSSLGICSNRPETGYMFNPCISAEVLIEVSNDGEYYSGGDNVRGTTLVSTARYGDGSKIYDYFLNYTINATFAEYTYILSDHYFTNKEIIDMDYNSCIIPRYSEEYPRERELGWFLLQSHDVAHVQVDLSHLESSPYFIYGQHYRIAIFVIPSRCDINLCSSSRLQLDPAEYLPCRYPREFSNWFLNSTVKNVKNNITVYALDDVLFKVEIHILHGLYAPFDNLFYNTTTVHVQSPSRSKSFIGRDKEHVETRQLTPYVSYSRKQVYEHYIFCAVYYYSYTSTIAQALNMPPLYSDYERGRVLLMYNMSADNPNAYTFIDDYNILYDSTFWSQPSTTVDESKELLDAYFETFQHMTYDSSSGYSYSFTEVLLPYLPYFSNCFTFDSYIPLWLLFEGNECALPDTYPSKWRRYKYPALVDQDQVEIVGPFDFFKTPIADWCERNLTCNYDEQLANVGSTARWFEQTTGTALFQLLRYPVNYLQYTGRAYVDKPSIADEGGATIISEYYTKSVDNFIPVTYDHSAGDTISGCSSNCFGRTYTLEITYYQYTEYDKKIITATLTGADYDFNSTNTEYELIVKYYALGWVDLILNFAFDYTINSVLNIIIGSTLTVLSALLWLINRITTRLKSPPEFRFLGIYILFFPPIIAGVLLALIPIWLLTAFGNYIIFNEFVTDPQSPTTSAASGLVLDSFPSTYNNLGYAISDSAVSALRNQRVGTMFCIIGFCCLISASKLYFIKAETKREREIAKLRTNLALREHQWHPVLWKKSNMIFTAYCLSLFLTILVEVSLWSSFSNYQFIAMTIIISIGVVFDYIFTLQMQDEMLSAPLNTAFGFVGQFVTFGANNYLQFVLSYAYGIIVAMFFRLYFDTYWSIFESGLNFILKLIIDGLNYAIPKYIIDENKYLVKFLTKKDEKLRQKRRDVSKALYMNKEDPSNDNLNENDVNGPDDDSKSAEPFITKYSSMCNDMIVLCCFPFIIYLLMQYRTQTGIPASYGIRQSDMIIYLVFQCFMIVFEPFYAVFNICTLELYRGWKCYDYLIYCRYRYLQRDTRWKGLEDSVDESLEESLRNLDQMCFSSQYFMMLTIMTIGILYNILAMEVWLHSPSGSPSQYSPFSDPGLVLFAIILICMWICIEQGFYYLGILLNIWNIKHSNTSWHINYKSHDDFHLPGWRDMQGASHDAFIMNQRLSNDTFRFKFLNYNRSWLIQQLPLLLTPRTKSRLRPNLLNQLDRVTNVHKQDLSSDDEKIDKFEEQRQSFGRPILNESSDKVVRWWLNKARKRMKLKKPVEPFIRQARRYECERCLSRRQLQVEFDIDIDMMIALYEREYPDEVLSDEININQWKSFWNKHQIYHTVCLPCLAKARDDINQKNALQSIDDDNDSDQSIGYGPIQLSATSKAIMMNWYRQAKQQRKKKLEIKNKMKLVSSISDDEDEEDNKHSWTKEKLDLSSTTSAIAVKWLKDARYGIYQKSISNQLSSPMTNTNNTEGMLPGLRSKYMRK